MPLAWVPAAAQVPQDPELVTKRLLVRGMTRAFLGDHQAAAELYEQALRIRPEDPTVLAALAQAYSDLGDGVQATFYAERALTLAPDRPENLRVVAELRRSSGDAVGSLEALDQLVELRPADLAAHVDRADLLLGLEQRSAAADAYDVALQLAPQNPDVIRSSLDVELALGRLERALDRANRLTAHGADAADTQVRAEILVRLGRTGEAIQAFQRVLALSPSNQEAREALESLAPGLAEQQPDQSEDPVGRAARLAVEADDDLRNQDLRVAAIWANLMVADLATAGDLASDGLLFFPGSDGLARAAVEIYLHGLDLDEADRRLDDLAAISPASSADADAGRALVSWLRSGEAWPGDGATLQGVARAWADLAKGPSSRSVAAAPGVGDRPSEILARASQTERSDGAAAAADWLQNQTEPSFRTPLQWLFLGDLHARAGDRSAAVTAWQKALEGAPNSDLILSRLR